MSHSQFASIVSQACAVLIIILIAIRLAEVLL